MWFFSTPRQRGQTVAASAPIRSGQDETKTLRTTPFGNAPFLEIMAVVDLFGGLPPYYVTE